MALCIRRRAAIDPQNGVWDILVDGDPSAGAGCNVDDAGNTLGINSLATVAAPSGSPINGAVFQKTGAGATAWTNVSGQVVQ